VSGKSVIPEVVERPSEIQEKQYVIWIPELDFVSSGMTFGAVSILFQQPASDFFRGLPARHAGYYLLPWTQDFAKRSKTMLQMANTPSLLTNNYARQVK
jgi:hypothetical protein